jgi:outer membrane protein TolC
LPGSEEVWSLALDNRPEWGILSFKKSIRERKVGLAKADYFPSLALRGSYAKTNLDPDTPPEQATSGILRSESWYLFGTCSWKIFDSFLTRNKVREAEASLEEIKAREKQIKSRILSEIKEARLYFNAAKSKMPVAKEQVELAEENLRLALESYRSGVVGNLEYLEARKLLNETKVDLLQAETDFELAKAQVNLATGKDIFRIF